MSAKYDDHIMEAVRGRIGLDADDESRDAHIDHMPAERVARMALAWELGDDSWMDNAVSILKDCGFVLVPPTGESEWGEC